MVGVRLALLYRMPLCMSAMSTRFGTEPANPTGSGVELRFVRHSRLEQISHGLALTLYTANIVTRTFGVFYRSA